MELFPPGWKVEKERVDLKHSLWKIKVPLWNLQIIVCSEEIHIPEVLQILGRDFFGLAIGRRKAETSTRFPCDCFYCTSLSAWFQRVDANWVIRRRRFSSFNWISFLISSLPRFVISDVKFWWLNSKEASTLCGIKVTPVLNRWSLWNDLLSVVTLCSKDLHDVCELFALILCLMNEFSYIWDKLLIFLLLLIELYCAAPLELAPCRAVLSLTELL